jgi:carbon-monoxide dehydrogenase small subunit
MTNKRARKQPSLLQKEKAGSKAGVKPVASTGSAITDIASTKVSRRTLLRGTATAAAVVGVSAATMKMAPKEQTSSVTSTFTYGQYTQTNTATAPVVPPLVATDPFGEQTLTLNINGKNVLVNAFPRTMLVDALREGLDMTATKRPCNRSMCGGCTVLIDGKAFEACTIPAIRAVGHVILTGEVATGDPVVNALQQAFVTADGGQCTYCGPGFVMAAAALLKANPSPTIPQIKAALSGNLCRCGNYTHIINAVQLAATNLGGA